MSSSKVPPQKRPPSTTPTASTDLSSFHKQKNSTAKINTNTMAAEGTAAIPAPPQHIKSGLEISKGGLSNTYKYKVLALLLFM